MAFVYRKTDKQNQDVGLTPGPGSYFNPKANLNKK